MSGNNMVPGKGSPYSVASSIFLVAYGALFVFAAWLLSADVLERNLSPDGEIEPAARGCIAGGRIALLLLGAVCIWAAAFRQRRGRSSGRLDKRVARAGVLCTSVLVCILLAETGARFYFFTRQEDLADALLRREAVNVDSGADLKLIDIIRLSDNERLVYEFVPGASGSFRGVRLELNEDGQRGRLRHHAKAEGIFRIVGLGDSIPFGFGIDEEDTYLSILERRLTADGYPCEVVNLAVPGYNTAMEVEMLHDRGLRYDPDLVILTFCGNDFSLPNYLKSKRNLMTPRRSYLYDLLTLYTCLVRGFEPVAWEGEHFTVNMDLVPENYRYMVGREGVVSAFERLAHFTGSRGIPVMIEYYRDYHKGIPDMEKYDENNLQPFLREICRENGFYLCDCTRRLYEYAAGEKKHFRKLFWLAADDPHPSLLANRLVAECLKDCVVSEGIIREPGDAL